jgi:hypothetical protein
MYTLSHHLAAREDQVPAIKEYIDEVLRLTDLARGQSLSIFEHVVRNTRYLNVSKYAYDAL